MTEKRKLEPVTRSSIIKEYAGKMNIADYFSDDWIVQRGVGSGDYDAIFCRTFSVTYSRGCHSVAVAVVPKPSFSAEQIQKLQGRSVSRYISYVTRGDTWCCGVTQMGSFKDYSPSYGPEFKSLVSEYMTEHMEDLINEIRKEKYGLIETVHIQNGYEDNSRHPLILEAQKNLGFIPHVSHRNPNTNNNLVSYHLNLN